MRRVRDLLGLLLLSLAGVQGCALSEKEIKPPKPPEEFKAPPEEDPRYSKPVEYPKDLMDQDILLKRGKDASKGAPNPLQGARMGPAGAGRPPGM